MHQIDLRNFFLSRVTQSFLNWFRRGEWNSIYGNIKQ